MKSASNILKSRNEAKFQMLRTQLDKLSIIQPIDYTSLDAIEIMLNEMLSLKKKIEYVTSHNEELIEKNESQTLTITAYKHQNNDLFKENAELHNEILIFLEKGNYQGKDIEMKRLNDDASTFKFLLIAEKQKTLKYQTELMEMKQKHLELISTIYEKRVDMSKMFSEVNENDQLLLKSRGIDYTTEDFGQTNSSMGYSYIPRNPPNTHGLSMSLSNINNNRVDNRSGSMCYGSNSNMNNRMKKGNQDMVEKLYKLEMELNDKNKEIIALKKNLNNDNTNEQKIVIEYLKNELQITKEKYENYLKFQLNQAKQSSHSQYHSTTHISFTKKRCSSSTNPKGVISQNKSTSNISSIQNKLNSLEKENKLLKDELKRRLEIDNKYEEKKENPLTPKEQFLKKGTDMNLIASLTNKLRETNGDLLSSKQHYKFQVNDYEKKYIALQKKINDLTNSIAMKDNECLQYKQTISSLNKRLLYSKDSQS